MDFRLPPIKLSENLPIPPAMREALDAWGITEPLQSMSDELSGEELAARKEAILRRAEKIRARYVNEITPTVVIAPVETNPVATDVMVQPVKITAASAPAKVAASAEKTPSRPAAKRKTTKSKKSL